jgi:hypothetical protein
MYVDSDKALWVGLEKENSNVYLLIENMRQI